MFEATHIPPAFADMVAPMQAGHRRILAALAEQGFAIEDYPAILPPADPCGVAAARAYPMQGVLKYHGLSDWDWRIAFLPSISVTNPVADTLTYVSFDPNLATDDISIGGSPAQGRDRERVQQTLNALRRFAGIDTAAQVISRNRIASRTTGKGLGSSASASAALAMAATAALFGEELAGNRRFLSCTARLLAGSGCRSATGGLSLWLAYPGAPHHESFALRLDRDENMVDLRLVTVPIDSRIGLKTEAAHHDAPESPFFKSWMLSRADEIIEGIGAIRRSDWRSIGQLAELDSIRLHGVTMSGSRENKLFAWEPENIALFRMANELRTSGVPVYASTDTGPTVVFLTHREHSAQLVAAILSLDLGLDVLESGVGGPATLVPLETARAELG